MQVAAVDEFCTVVSQNKLLDEPDRSRGEILLEAEVGPSGPQEGMTTQRGPVWPGPVAAAEVYYELDRNNDAIAAVNAGLDLVEQLLHEYPGQLQALSQAGRVQERHTVDVRGRTCPDDPAAAEAR